MNYSRTIPDDPAAYERGKQRRIHANATRGRQLRFDRDYPGLAQRIRDADSRTLPRWIKDALLEWGGLTPKQAEVAVRLLDTNIDRAWDDALAEQQRRATTPVWTAGRQRVTGVVVSARWENYAITSWLHAGTLKGLILLADGRKLWTTIPQAACPERDSAETVRGQTLSVTVTVTPKDSDPTFGFGKRPVLTPASEAL